MGIFLSFDYEKLLYSGLTPLVALIIVGAFIKKAIWPRIAQYLDDARAERIEAQRVLKERAESLEKREETVLQGFTDALDGLKEALETSSRRQESQILMMTEILTTTKDTNNIAKGRR